MKLTTLIFFVTTLHISATILSQDTKIDLHVTNGTIADIFNAIEKQSDFRVFYNVNQIDLKKQINYSAEGMSINNILTDVLDNLDATFELYDKVIVIIPAGIKQDLKVSGTVTDAITGEPLPGVYVVIKGTNSGTTTDVNGKYSLDVSDQSTVLIFSYVGYESTEMIVGANAILDIKLSAGFQTLEEVVVVGYGQSSRKKLTSAITSVDQSDLNRGAISDIGQMLQGKIPGLNISASGDPNRTAAVILRGASTLNSSQGPFYVIDGIPGADISTVSLDDVVTIDVLKDAAATSIYGNRAANGVIMITTKRGKEGVMQVSYNGYFGIEKVSNNLDMMSAGQLRNFVDANGQAFTPEDDLGADTDWQREVQRTTAYSTSHNLSFSGGTERNTYSASLTYLNKEGILLGSNQKRLIARLAVEQTALNDRVKFGLTVSNSNTVENNVPQRNVVLLQAVKRLPVSPVFDDDGNYAENFNNTGYFNPVALLKHGKDDSKYNRLVAGFTTHVKLPFGLTYDLNVSYQNEALLHGEYYDSYYENYNSANFYSNPEPPYTHGLLNFGDNGSALRSSYQNYNTLLENYITWDKTFGDHSVNAVIGYSWQNNVFGDGFQSTSTNFPVDEIGYNNLAMSNYQSVTGYVVNFGDANKYWENRLISDFARLNYNYKQKYLIQASVRRDGSSVFGKNERWGYFPSVGLAWRVSEEGFMDNLTLINDLKLRASYGVTGNSSGFNAYTAQFISGSLGTFYYNGNQIGSYGPTKAANADLRWEKTSTVNIGIDFTLLQGRIGGSFEWYNKETKDMIYDYAVDIIKVPAGIIVANGGSISNKGVEVSLNIKPVQNKNFSWTTEINLAHNKNLIESLTNPLFSGGDSVRHVQPDGGGQTGSTLQILKSGKPLGQFFTLNYAGKNAEGVSQYYDRDGNLTTTPAIGTDYYYAGNAQPKLLLGWTNSFAYKNIDLTVFIRGVFGNKIFNATRADLFRPTTAHSSNILVDAGKESPDDVNSYKYSSRFIESGNYIRFDNATLGYNFNVKNNFVQSLRLYVSTNNLFVITKYKGIDPEVNQGGIAPGIDSNNFYPKTRTVLFGLNVSF